jgi:hypothetical protein
LHPARLSHARLSPSLAFLAPPRFFKSPQQIFGAVVGLGGATVSMTLRSPAVTTGISTAFRATMLEILPFTVGISALYTVGQCVAADITGSSGPAASAVGGALAGAFAMGVKRRSGQAGLVGALGFGAIAAASEFFPAFEPSAADLAPSRAADSPSRVVSPSEFSAGTAAGSTLIRRLQ